MRKALRQRKSCVQLLAPGLLGRTVATRGAGLACRSCALTLVSSTGSCRRRHLANQRCNSDNDPVGGAIHSIERLTTARHIQRRKRMAAAQPEL